MKERIYLASPHMSEEGYEQSYVKEAFETNWVAPLGPNVTNFEQELATYVGVNSTSALSSGTAAIHLGLKALGVEAGDVVFCSTLTFSASCNPILYLGATPVFIDSDAKTWNMCPKALKLAFEAAEKNNQIPKAVVVVNLYGQSADMDPIIELCEQYQVPILEDAAESLGATYKGRMSGTIGDIGIYSFNGNKIITTSGGGMLVSNNEAYTKKATFWATQSREAERHYEHKEIGFNYRMSNVVAGIGRGQLKVLNERIAKKKEIYETYQEAFKEIEEIEMMNICDFGQSNYWLSVMTLKETSKVKPLDIMLALEAENIESRPVWKPMHLQPIFKQYPFFTVSENIPVSEDYFNRGVCLPSDTKMTTEQQNHIIELIKKLF
ncbi:aminotransferase class V-fold PLP-dependent enzyme [Turicibacter bilis]|uniref:DegT/DnrJ/EryC1/StrS family aminotransferase n=1 Tax=Turicibacter bilis TaxID=2735723 RepID=UPI001BB097D8|nr:aminotransferase class V-fold PLP-dependent enzyme [Turicibacter bilis]MBS3203753.1 aminotransferase class V-fold PLP-dependent enzyme [Turicibacter bilis]UUF11116.1 aminotransferase class V-fold PLP-dependent enzyme [Turicibacter bilis]